MEMIPLPEVEETLESWKKKKQKKKRKINSKITSFSIPFYPPQKPSYLEKLISKPRYILMIKPLQVIPLLCGSFFRH